ncbi:MAG: DUF433 domain-containing protein [Chloroflexi bacterium]|nr:DUF433 domain-containing protein [Chloroflexota bacterium]
MEVRERIIIDPRIQHGKSVIRGTRVPVARIIAEFAAGMTREEVMREYEINAEDVAAALARGDGRVMAHLATGLVPDVLTGQTDVGRRCGV